jgi:ornithine cyclodeaminase/alanine dehydrogenase-like protein (mu-crystallin family)
MADPAPAVPPLRYLSTADIDACLPSVGERIDLAQEALVALARGEAEMPAKLGVHPRAEAFSHAMPAWLRTRDLVGLKWVSAYSGNKAIGLPAISGLVVLNDAETGVPTWLMDAARITAVRTAAVSGVAIRLLAAPDASRVALLGGGVQARSHLEVLAALMPSATVAIYDRHADRREGLAAEHNALAEREWARPAASAAEAVEGADVVITVASLGAKTQRLEPADVAPGALVVAVDFATYASPGLARAAATFAVDDREQFLRYRELGYFDDYPDPGTTMGQLAIDSGGTAQPRADGRTALVTHLGVGLADVVTADAIARRADWAGLGAVLER